MSIVALRRRLLLRTPLTEKESARLKHSSGLDDVRVPPVTLFGRLLILYCVDVVMLRTKAEILYFCECCDAIGIPLVFNTGEDLDDVLASMREHRLLRGNCPESTRGEHSIARAGMALLRRHSAYLRSWLPELQKIMPELKKPGVTLVNLKIRLATCPLNVLLMVDELLAKHNK